MNYINFLPTYLTAHKYLNFSILYKKNIILLTPIN